MAQRQSEKSLHKPAKKPNLAAKKPEPDREKINAKRQSKLNGLFINAVIDGNGTEIVRLIKAGADITVTPKDRDGRTALHIAINQRYAQICALLIEQCAKSGGDVKGFITAKDRDGQTALHYAAWHGNAKVCILLVEEYARAGGNIRRFIAEKVGNTLNSTAVRYAKAGGHAKTAQLLKSMPSFYAFQDWMGKETFSELTNSLNECIAA